MKENIELEQVRQKNNQKRKNTGESLITAVTKGSWQGGNL